MELIAQPLDRLSFFNSSTSELWSVEASGDYTADCRKGRAVADELILDMQTNNSPTLLGHVAQAIVSKGRHGGIEVGFWHRVGEHLT